MKISVSTEGEFVSEHFGRCPEFTIVSIENGKLAEVKKVHNPGHAPGAIPEFLNKMNVECIICGGIGARAKGFFEEYKIDVIAGIEGKVDDVIEMYISGNLEGGQSICIPGGGRGYGIDKTVCDHAHE